VNKIFSIQSKLLLSALLLFTVSCSLLNIPAPTATPEAPVASTEETAPAAATQTSAPETSFLVYFPNTQNYADNILPFEEPVERAAPADASLPEAAVEAYFAGPTAEEQSRNLAVIPSGFTGLDRIEITDGVAHVFLTGDCSSGGATYTIAQPLMATLMQFDNIQYVKIYYQSGQTGTPEGQDNSIPFCLEP
jgi:spore germination protein GerM